MKSENVSPKHMTKYRNYNMQKHYWNKVNQQQKKQKRKKRVVLHKATCSKCETEIQVSFKPDGTRPIFCKPCYQTVKNGRSI